MFCKQNKNSHSEYSGISITVMPNFTMDMLKTLGQLLQLNRVRLLVVRGSIPRLSLVWHSLRVRYTSIRIINRPTPEDVMT